MTNQLCNKCGGKGFHWIKTGWKTGPANIRYVKGPNCRTCGGSGEYRSKGCLIAGLAILAIFIGCLLVTVY